MLIWSLIHLFLQHRTEAAALDNASERSGSTVRFPGPSGVLVISVERWEIFLALQINLSYLGALCIFILSSISYFET